MKKDIKYIIKRILIGTGIALMLMFLNKMHVYALDVSSVATGGQVSTITTATDRKIYTVTGNPWANWGTGYLYFNFSISKTAGASTDPIALPRSVVAYSGSSNFYVCDLGTVNTNNSTYVGTSFTAKCSMKMGSQGLTQVAINFNYQNSTPTFSSYQLMIEDVFTFEQTSDNNVNVNVNNNGTISNDNQNTQSIISNQNQNTQDIINSNKSCKVYDLTEATFSGYIDSNGNFQTNTSSKATDYIPIDSNTEITVLTVRQNGTSRTCFYDSAKSKISCRTSFSVGETLTIPSGASFIRFTIDINEKRPTFNVCKNGSQAISDSINEQTNAVNEVNNSINNDNVDSANSKATDFFDNFSASEHGLSGIVSSPLRLINAFASSSCSPLVIPLPFVQENATIPCMSTIYSQFPTFYSLWQLITTGLIAYWICIKIFGKVHEFQDPETDKVEVLDL